MNMFGFFYLLFTSFCKIKYDIDSSLYDIDSRSRGKITYFDHDQVQRLVSNNHPVHYVTGPHGNACVYDEKEDRIVYDAVAERLKKENEGKRFIRLDYKRHDSLEDLIKGNRFYDTVKKKVCVIRYIYIYEFDENGKLIYNKATGDYQKKYMGKFYMDINGYLIELIELDDIEYDVEEFIKCFNEYIDKKKEEIENKKERWVNDKLGSLRYLYNCKCYGVNFKTEEKI